MLTEQMKKDNADPKGVIIKGNVTPRVTGWDWQDSTPKKTLWMISNSGDFSFGDGVTPNEAATAFLEAYNKQFNEAIEQNKYLKSMLAEQKRRGEMTDSKLAKSNTAELFRIVDLPPISNEAKAVIATIYASMSKTTLEQFVNADLSADDMRGIARHVLRNASEDEPDAHYKAAFSYIVNISQNADDMRSTARSALNSVSEPNIKDCKHQSE